MVCRSHLRGSFYAPLQQTVTCLQLIRQPSGSVWVAVSRCPRHDDNFYTAHSSLLLLWCWSNRVLTLISAPTVQSSSTVAHQRFRTRFNFSHNIDCIVRCAMLGFIWYFYLCKQVGHFRSDWQNNWKYLEVYLRIFRRVVKQDYLIQYLRKYGSSHWIYLTIHTNFDIITLRF